MLFYILILFGLYGWIEFEALILIGSEIGGLASFLGIFLTAFIGVALLRSQGRLVMARWQENLAKGRIETDALAGAVSLLCGGFLMLLPGYVTDGLGLLCFVPGLRVLIGRFLLSRLSVASLASRFGNRYSAQTTQTEFSFETRNTQDQGRNHDNQSAKIIDGDIIEGDFHKKD